MNTEITRKTFEECLDERRVARHLRFKGRGRSGEWQDISASRGGGGAESGKTSPLQGAGAGRQGSGAERKSAMTMMQLLAWLELRRAVEDEEDVSQLDVVCARAEKAIICHHSVFWSGDGRSEADLASSVAPTAFAWQSLGELPMDGPVADDTINDGNPVACTVSASR